MERRKYSIKTLLVDNDIEFLNYEMQVLDGLVSGEVYTASDGKRAFEIFQKYNPDIILMDTNLPIMSDIELISRIRETNSLIDNYIIVFSDNDNGSDEPLALKLGANNYISKPVRPLKLVSHFSSAVETIYSIIELKFENYLLQQNSFRDVLTGLVNKDYLFERSREEELKAYRYRRNLSCMRLGFDGIGNIMSDMGEKIMENITIEGARLFKDNLRKSDIIGRIEDSEFGILLPETNISQAETAGTKIQNAIRGKDFFSDSDPLHITVSIGVSSSGASENGMLNKAKNALNEAKALGPNSIVLNTMI